METPSEAIQQLAMYQPIVRMVLHAHENNGGTYEQALEVMVVELSKALKITEKIAMDVIAQKPAPHF